MLSLNPGLVNNHQASIAVNRSKPQPGVVAEEVGSRHLLVGSGSSVRQAIEGK
jgi:hypothetical protein